MKTFYKLLYVISTLIGQKTYANNFKHKLVLLDIESKTLECGIRFCDNELTLLSSTNADNDQLYKILKKEGLLKRMTAKNESLNCGGGGSSLSNE